MTDIESVADQRADNDRATVGCPNCQGTVREPRSGDKWICDGCARYWDAAELPEVA
jgi:ribosomal protein L37AE/L43A